MTTSTLPTHYGRVISQCHTPSSHAQHSWRWQGQQFWCAPKPTIGHVHDFAEESSLSSCDFGCKHYGCPCGATEVQHMASYGCPAA